MIWTDYCPFMRRPPMPISDSSGAHWSKVHHAFKNKIGQNISAFDLCRNKEPNVQMHLIS